MEESPETLIAGRSPDTEESEESTEIPEPTETAKAQDMEESPGTPTPGGSPDTEESEESTEIPESTETAKNQDMEESAGTLKPRRSPDTEESEKSTEIPESTETAKTQDMEELPGTLTPRGSPDTEESEESTETAKGQNMEESPETQTPGGSPDTEDLSDYENIINIPEVPAREENQDTTGTQISISPGTENNPDTEIPMGAQSLEANTDGESVPLNSQTGALVPVQYNSPLYYLWWLWSAWPWFCSPTIEEDPASFGGKIGKIRTILLSTYSYIWWYFSGYHTVGIFSRSSESDYDWLIKQLKSEPFHSTVSTIIPHYISNNGKKQFIDDVSQCTFGILYHTKNRGRINIVDVTDSLYDEELKYMSEYLGKENVIVVVDDVEDTSDGAKTQILKNQPSIENLARDILLFSATEKPVTISKVTQES